MYIYLWRSLKNHGMTEAGRIDRTRFFHHQLYELWPVRKVSLREREVEEKGSGCTVFHDQ